MPTRGPVVDGDDGVGDAGQVGERGLDLAEFDAESVDLDLVVGATDELDVAGRGPPGEVAGAVEPFPVRAERVGDEPGGGGAALAVVAAGELDSADVDLADRRRAPPAPGRVRAAGCGRRAPGGRG